MPDRSSFFLQPAPLGNAPAVAGVPCQVGSALQWAKRVYTFIPLDLEDLMSEARSDTDKSLAQQTSPYGFAALAALVGLFSEQALLKLKGVSEIVFTKGEIRKDDIASRPESDVAENSGEKNNEIK